MPPITPRPLPTVTPATPRRRGTDSTLRTPPASPRGTSAPTPKDAWAVTGRSPSAFLAAVLAQRPEALPRGLLQSTSESGYLVAIEQADAVQVASALSRFDAGLSTPTVAARSVGAALGDEGLGAYGVALHEVITAAVGAAQPFDAAQAERDFTAALAGGGLGRLLDVVDDQRPLRRAAAVLERLSPQQFFNLMGAWLKDERRRTQMLAPGPLWDVFERQASSLAALEFHRLAHGQVVARAGEVVKSDLALHLQRVWPLALSLTTVT